MFDYCNLCWLYGPGLGRYTTSMTDDQNDTEIDPSAGEVSEPLRRALGDRYLTLSLIHI